MPDANCCRRSGLTQVKELILCNTAKGPEFWFKLDPISPAFSAITHASGSLSDFWSQHGSLLNIPT
jgi:hypothetical protein